MEQPNFHYFECPDCQFSGVGYSDAPDLKWFCPMCMGDNGHEVQMTRRVCQDTDRPEGMDARNSDMSI